jgi:ABC-2 type transport system ATP-binding protein
MPILQINSLTKNFATQKAVNNISLTIERGQIFGLLGPNGAGKTTLIRMITGIFYPDQGEIIFDGKPFDPINDIAHIGYMPEERGLYKKMKIGEQALYLAQLKGLSKSDATAKIKDWFNRFDMQSWWNKKVEDLSKGMSQKLQFVTTVLHSPKLIILDEPFSGLDPVNANLIRDEIYRLAKEGATIIFSTHRMEQVEEICDHIVLVNKGEKILDGTVNEVKQDFKENLFKVSFNNELLAEHLAIHLFEVQEKKNNSIVLRRNEGFSNNDIIQYFINKGLGIESFNEILPSLNQIFIKLVEGTPTARQFNN